MKIALIQTNPTVGDLVANAAEIKAQALQAASNGVDVAVFPELAICGYPPRDLLRIEAFRSACVDAADTVAREIAKTAPSLTLILGSPRPIDHSTRVANSILVYTAGQRTHTYDKQLLPTYDVFDEHRYFTPGADACTVTLGSHTLGIAICEDLWRGNDIGQASRYDQLPDPIAQLAAAGATCIISPSASPFGLAKPTKHRAILTHHATQHQIPVLAVNQVGGNDDLIFDGSAACVGPDGTLRAAGPAFETAQTIVDLDHLPAPIDHDPATDTDDERLLIDALTIGIRDYLAKTGFRSAVLGLSGGIDSALTAALAVRALGSESVSGAAMPSDFSSSHSVEDALDLADRLAIVCQTIPIASSFESLKAVLDPAFVARDFAALGESLPDLTQENLQSRVRGAIMMALSNRTGALVLTTGNKSELAVGYCTLYGDMNGGLAVLADLPKTLVFKLSRYLNKHHQSLGFDRAPIPERTITKPPSAELAPNQLDSDSLPDYDVLDTIVELHVEQHQTADQIIEATSFDPEEVRRVCRMIDRNEYKRRQLAIGLKVTSVAFGPGRRFPIAQRYAR